VDALGDGRDAQARSGERSTAPVVRPFRARSSRRISPCPLFLRAAALEPTNTGSSLLWEDYTPGETLHHPERHDDRGGRPHDGHPPLTRTPRASISTPFSRAATPFGRRLVYGGHVISLCRALSHDGLENAFAVAAIHGGAHSNPTFAGDTIYCRHVSPRARRSRDATTWSVAARMIGAKNVELAKLPDLAPGEKNEAGPRPRLLGAHSRRQKP